MNAQGIGIAARAANLDVDHPRSIALQCLARVLGAADALVKADRRTDAALQDGVVVQIVPGQRLLDIVKREGIERALQYMGLEPDMPVSSIKVDKIFIGSCTNSRIEDLRAAAQVAKGRRVADNVKLAMVVPGSGLVKAQAEQEGLDKIFEAAGFEWRMPGCSMCLAMNSDRLSPGERCASTSNRNFEGRQGAGGRTHLLSPAMAAAAAIAGRFADVRDLL